MYKNIIPGLLFSVFWATGSVAVKFGFLSADTMVLACMRFLLTGLIFAPFFLFSKTYRFIPKGKEWLHLLVYGFLNTTLTLGAFFASQKYASAGISTLFIALTPLLVSLLSTFMLKRKLRKIEIAGMLIAFSGLVIASVNELQKAYIKPVGIILLLVYIIAYSLSSIYFSKIETSISNAVFNVWQVFIGGLILLPFCFAIGKYHVYHFDSNLWLSLAWMIVILSFSANQLWLYLVKKDPVGASSWLYLTPVFGYLYGYLVFGEQITVYSVIGAAMVIAGLALSKKTSKKSI